jgi:hypothetical protein
MKTSGNELVENRREKIETKIAQTLYLGFKGVVYGSIALAGVGAALYYGNKDLAENGAPGWAHGIFNGVLGPIALVGAFTTFDYVSRATLNVVDMIKGNWNHKKTLFERITGEEMRGSSTCNTGSGAGI